MRCLINYARSHSGTHGVDGSNALERPPAEGRRRDAVRLQPHGVRPAGRPLRARVRLHVGEQWRWGENLAWGRGKNGTARARS